MDRYITKISRNIYETGNANVGIESSINGIEIIDNPGIGIESNIITQLNELSYVELENYIPPGSFMNNQTLIKTKIKIRRYQNEYLKYGFYYCGDKNNEIPFCLICNQKFTNNSMKPAMLTRHFKNNHKELKNLPLSYFEEIKREYLKKTSVITSTFLTNNKALLEASLKVSYRVACLGEAHTICEKLVKPCAIDLCEIILGPNMSEKIKQVPLSNDTVKRRILMCSDNIENELIRRIKLSPYFSLQLDESTDISSLAVLLVFVRYIYNNEIHEDILICDDLDTNTSGSAIFEKINSFFLAHKLDWRKVVDVCSDGAKAMVGCVSGVVSRIKEVAHPTFSSSHCVLHRENLVVKNISIELKNIFKKLTELVNYIKSSALNTRIFRQVCIDMNSSYENLLFYTEVRWLSRGKFIMRVFQLSVEILEFLKGRRSETILITTRDKIDGFIQFMSNNLNLMGIAYLADIFDKLNGLNLSLQGKSTNFFIVNDRISAFKSKIILWINKFKSGQCDTFEALSSFIIEKNINIDSNLQKEIIEHLSQLSISFDDYFPVDAEIQHYKWIANPFLNHQSSSALTTKDEEDLITISFNSSLKEFFPTVSLSAFWGSLYKSYPNISNKALRKLLPFVTTYLCETGFAKYCDTKSKKRNRLDASADIRCQLSDLEPDFKEIVKKLTQHTSH